MILSPDQYTSVTTYELLDAASRGHVGLDHRFINAIADRGGAALPDLLRFGLEHRDGDRVDLEIDLLNLFRHFRTPEALPFLLKCARRHHEEISDELAEAFTALGPDGVDPLLALYEELGEEEGGEVAFLLASLRVRDARITEALLDRLDSEAGDGAFLLGLHGDAAAAAVLKERLEEVSAGDPGARWLRRELEEAIRDTENPPGAAGVEESEIRDAYPEVAPPQFEALTQEERLAFLDSPVAEYRALAGESFSGDELSGEARGRLFDVARSDPDADVRARCWEVLGGLSDNGEIRQAMLARLLDESAPREERCGALVGLALGPDDTEVDRCMQEFYRNPASRAKALEAMRRTLDRQYAPYFPKHLDDPDREIRRQAVWGVGNLALHAEAPRLRPFFEDEELRSDALYAYALAAPGETSWTRMPRLLRKIDELAGGLSPEEAYLVKSALNDRLASHGLPPAYFRETGEEPEDWIDGAPASGGAKSVGRNERCPCGSGKKYKKCCGS